MFRHLGASAHSPQVGMLSGRLDTHIDRLSGSYYPRRYEMLPNVRQAALPTRRHQTRRHRAVHGPMAASRPLMNPSSSQRCMPRATHCSLAWLPDPPDTGRTHRRIPGARAAVLERLHDSSHAGQQGSMTNMRTNRRLQSYDRGPDTVTNTSKPDYHGDIIAM